MHGTSDTHRLNIPHTPEQEEEHETYGPEKNGNRNINYRFRSTIRTQILHAHVLVACLLYTYRSIDRIDFRVLIYRCCNGTNHDEINIHKNTQITLAHNDCMVRSAAMFLGLCLFH